MPGPLCITRPGHDDSRFNVIPFVCVCVCNPYDESDEHFYDGPTTVDDSVQSAQLMILF